jgi:hypothetical protein
LVYNVAKSIVLSKKEEVTLRFMINLLWDNDK